MNFSSNKLICRSYAKRIRDEIHQKDRIEKSLKIKERLFSTDFDWDQYNNIGVYLNIGSEVETRGIITSLIKMNKRVFLPQLSEHKLLFYLIEDLKKDVCWTSYIYEPIVSKKSIFLNDLDAMLIPGIAFDRHGNRIGYGGGYYDRFLSTQQPLTYTIELSYCCCVFDYIPHDRHDYPVKTLVLEDDLLFIK